MGKRSSFERKKNDFYATPHSAVLPLLPHLSSNTTYIEPCVGEGDLVKHLDVHGHVCTYSSDLPHDVATTKYNVGGASHFITNPPWSRFILHPAIDNLRMQLPTWLLFDADWMHTIQAKPYLPFCEKIVSVGRVKWISDSPHTSLDNASWYLFVDKKVKTEFIGR